MARRRAAVAAVALLAAAAPPPSAAKAGGLMGLHGRDAGMEPALVDYRARLVKSRGGDGARMPEAMAAHQPSQWPLCKVRREALPRAGTARPQVSPSCPLPHPCVRPRERSPTRPLPPPVPSQIPANATPASPSAQPTAPALTAQVKMRDGVVLNTIVYFPLLAKKAPKVPVGTVLYRTPYNATSLALAYNVSTEVEPFVIDPVRF